MTYLRSTFYVLLFELLNVICISVMLLSACGHIYYETYVLMSVSRHFLLHQYLLLQSHDLLIQYWDLYLH